MSTVDTVAGADSRPSEAPAAEHRVEQLLALNRAAIAINSELDLDALLQKIVDCARDLIVCKYAALGVLGDDGYIVRFPTSGISQIDREKIGAPPRGHGLLGVMLHAGRTLRVPDISKDPRRVGFPPNHPNMTSLLGVPIFMQGKLVGDLYMTDKIGRAEFDEEDEWLAQLLATHASTALTNAQLHAENAASLERISRERARSQALLKVTQSINRSVDLDEVIEFIVESPVELLGAAGAALYLVEHAPGDTNTARHTFFVARYAVGLEESLTTERTLLPVEGSVAGRAVKTGKTQVVPDISLDEGTVLPRLAGKELKSLVSVPLISNGELLGTLSTYSDKLNAFSAEDAEMLEAFGAVASAALHNARLYNQAQRGREAAEREQERLRELEQMKDEFLSTAAHELRTPLTTIRMSAGLAYEQMRMMAEADAAGKSAIDPRLVDLVGLVVEGSQRMHSLVNDLLDLTRLEQGRATLNMEDLDLREVVRASVEATMPLFESKKQRLTMHLPEVYCGVRGDAQRLEQVIINLLSNAHKYSPAGSPVEVRALKSREECRVTVRDVGSGVPPEERDRIFDRFYRSTVHRNDRTPSTGLGLPIARKIAEMHRGRLWVEPAPGGGSIFTLALPVAGG